MPGRGGPIMLGEGWPSSTLRSPSWWGHSLRQWAEAPWGHAWASQGHPTPQPLPLTPDPAPVTGFREIPLLPWQEHLALPLDPAGPTMLGPLLALLKQDRSPSSRVTSSP